MPMPVRCRSCRRRAVIEVVRSSNVLRCAFFANSLDNGHLMRWLSAPFRWYRSAYFERPWLFILVTLILCEAAAVAFILVSPKKYTASAIIMPIIADKPDQRLLGGGSGEGVANLLFGGQKVPPEFDRFMQTLASTTLSERLLQDPEFLQAFFANEWDPETRSWRPPGGPVAWVKSQVAKATGLPPYIPPNADRIRDAIQDNLNMKSGVASNAQVVTYDHTNPQAALYVLRTVIADNDQVNREQIANQISSLISRINALLSSTTDLTMRDTLIPLLVEQRRRQLAVQGDTPFAIDVIDPPSVSVAPTSPKPLLLLVVIGVFAIFAASSALIFRITLRGLGDLANATQ
ncbi:hypothetical protein FFK22_023430 [Mycobacterium sp. KBS0706]|nr:hypothetical protein FFK22_023430 [Mycobacterium sp. KBS0706]